MQQHLVSARDAAAYLGASEAAVRRWVARGRLRAVRVGRALRIARSELDAVVARGTLDSPAGGGEATTEAARSPLPWAIREAERYLAAVGDVETARAALDAIEARS